MTAQCHDNWETALTTHVGAPEQLLSAAERATKPTELVVLPEQLHQRNLKRQLARRSQPRSSLRFRSPAAIAVDILGTTGDKLEALDRVDRIRRIERIAGRNPDALDPFKRLFGRKLEAQATTIEAVRAAVEAITGYTDCRLEALKKVTGRCSQPAQADGQDYIDGAVATQRALAEATESRVSTDGVLIEAARRLRDTNTLFGGAYPTIERLHIAGVSGLGAPLLELLQAVATATPVDIHLYLRPGTGPGIAAFLRGESGTVNRQTCELGIPATELVATTRSQEARAALALVDQLRATGVSPSDIVIAARLAETYEQPLRRAATHYGHPISVWSQLPVTDTRPYQLLDTCCQLLARYAAGETIGLDTLSAAPALGWVGPVTMTWQPSPLQGADLESTVSTDTPRTVAAWNEALEQGSETPDILSELCSWLESQPQRPDPGDVRSTFNPVLERYLDLVIPAYREQQSTTQRTLVRLARAHERIEQLVDEAADKYDRWLATDQTAQSWATVRYLVDTLATVAPGRRDHTAGAVVDVIDGTDAWLREVPVVIAMGLVDGEWPQQPGGHLPDELRERISANNTAGVRRLPARTQWTQARDYDHFASTVAMATDHLICTRYQQTPEGTGTHRSPFLDAITTTTVDVAATTELCSIDATLPPPLKSVVQTAPTSGQPGGPGGGP